jgi:hypothetical protein
MQFDQENDNLIEQIRELQEKVADLERFALTSQDIKASKIALGAEQLEGLDDGDLALDGDIYGIKLGGIWIASAIVGLPYLRAAWDLGQMRDTGPHFGSIEGHGFDLTNVGIQALVVDNLISCGNFGVAGTDRAYAADGANYDIQGNEAYVTTAYRGLTIGCWAVIRTTFAAANNLMGKWTYTGNQKSYNLRASSGGLPTIYMSTDGTAVVSQASGQAMVEDEWSFIVGRFKASSSVKIYHGKRGTMYTDIDTTSIPATIHNGTSQFEIGSYNGGEGYWQGQIAWPFLCFGALPDSYINRIYNMTKRAFGH